jgi:bifunctional non-homologous end joining protein LigD
LEQITIEGKDIAITNPDKVLWPEAGITKLEYIRYLLSVADFLLPYSKDRLLMSWRYPEGAGTARIEEKAVPEYAPAWIPRAFYKDKDWILLNDKATLVWVANRAALELHVPFDRFDHQNVPTDLVFDLDPSDPDNYALVLEVALKLKEVLDSLGLRSIPKTSGATGLQIYVPIVPKYPYEDTRKLNKFIAEYIAQQMPQHVTLERTVNKRGTKLYFDYLQLWKMRTMPAPYSARARALGTVSAPITWEEVKAGFHPTDFTMRNMGPRLERVGDLFAPVTTEKEKYSQSLDSIVTFLDRHASL